jgi:hypothetical protein
MVLSIEEISDRLEITDLYARYVHAADDRDAAALDRIFLPHTTFDWSSTGGGKMTYLEARDGPAFRGDLFPWSFHVCTNIRIDLVGDGKSARVKSKTLCPMGREGRGGRAVMFQMQGSYSDKLERRGEEGWRIVERVWHEDWVAGPFGKVDGISGALGIADAA